MLSKENQYDKNWIGHEPMTPEIFKKEVLDALDGMHANLEDKEKEFDKKDDELAEEITNEYTTDARLNEIEQSLDKRLAE